MMKENLKKYLQSLFVGAPDTAQNRSLFDELYDNLCARYDDLTAAGMSPEDAFADAIGKLGDIKPLIQWENANQNANKATNGARNTEKEAARTPPPVTPPSPGEGKKKKLPPGELRRVKRIRSLGLAGAVMLYILWLVPVLLFDPYALSLFLFVAAGTVLLLLTHNMTPSFVDDSELTYDRDLCEHDRKISNILLALGVAFCILCIVPATVIPSDGGPALMFATVALGVGLILYALGIAPGLDKEAKSPPIGQSLVHPRKITPQTGQKSRKTSGCCPALFSLFSLYSQ